MASSEFPAEGLLYTCPQLDPVSPSEMLVNQLQVLQLEGDVNSGIREPLGGENLGTGMLTRKQGEADVPVPQEPPNLWRDP